MAGDDLQRQQLAILLELDKQIGDVCRSLALTTLRNLIATSPVDTGWFRANWIPAIGEGTEATDGSPKAVSTADQVAGAAQVASSFKLGTQGLITITNAVPYGARLNAGSSAQAPANFVEAAIEQAISLVQSYGMDKLDAAVGAAAGAGFV